MDGNKDEAERCIEIAHVSLKLGKIERAEKFLLKAEKLFPTQRAKDLLAKVRSTSNENKKPETSDTQEKGSEDVRRRKLSGSRNTEPEYTNEQIEAVRKVNKCKNYYEILCVTKEATDSDIKKSYKRLALQLHPDKNKAPGAAEAFKAVGNAAGVLTDPEKRKSYDLYGMNENANNRGHGNGGMRNNYYNNGFGYARDFQADISAEELFNMFFGGGMPQQNVYMRQQRRRQQRDEREVRY